MVSKYFDKSANDFPISLAHRMVDRLDGLVGAAFGPEAVGTRVKVRLPYRHQQHRHRRLHHPVFDRRDAQRSFPAALLGYHHPSHRTGPVALGSEFLLQAVEPLLASGRIGVDGGQSLAVHPRLSAVVPLRRQGRVEHVLAQQFPV